MLAESNIKEFELFFRNINVNLKEKSILKDVSGLVHSGEMVVVTGPKGCGKTTLLSVLSGERIPTTGDVYWNGQALVSKRYEIGFVQQHDLFLPNLTVRETLKYCALLRLSASVSTKEKQQRINDLVNMFGLDSCFNIIVQMLSSGMKKKLSVVCEMLLNPSLVLLDEPVTGLDYEDGLTLVRTLKTYTEKTKRSVVLSAQNCHSTLLHLCTNIMFLSHGNMAFYGTSGMLIEFLSILNEPCHNLYKYNPADKMLELMCGENLNDDRPTKDNVVKLFCEQRKTVEYQQVMMASKYLTELSEPDPDNDKVQLSIRNGNKQNNGEQSHRWNGCQHHTEEVKVLIQPLPGGGGQSTGGSKWLLPYRREFVALLMRNFENARRRILFPISIVQNMYILVICVLIWWRVERREDTIKDRLGLFFFTVVQWAFFALLDAILTFPKELKVVNKERKQNQYRLSAFCLSKTLSEIPLAVLQPCVYMCVMYWVANLNGFTAFLGSLGVLMLDVLAAQSIGVFVGTALQPPWTVTVVALGLLSMMLWVLYFHYTILWTCGLVLLYYIFGQFQVISITMMYRGAFNTPPDWLKWGKYASFFYYGLNAFIVLEFTDAPPIQCLLPNQTVIPVCKYSATNKTLTYFESEVVLLFHQIDWPLWCYLAVLAGIMIVSRLMWYMMLRRQVL